MSPRPERLLVISSFLTWTCKQSQLKGGFLNVINYLSSCHARLSTSFENDNKVNNDHLEVEVLAEAKMEAVNCSDHLMLCLPMSSRVRQEALYNLVPSRFTKLFSPWLPLYITGYRQYDHVIGIYGEQASLFAYRTKCKIYHKTRFNCDIETESA